MLELAGREALGERVGDLLELQCTLKRHRVAHVTAEEQEGVGVHHALGGRLDGLGLGVEHPLNLARHVFQGVEHLMNLIAEHRALDLRQIQAQQVGGGDLRHKRLGGCHGNFRAGVCVEHGVGFARNGGTLRVADGQHLGPLFARVAQGHQRIHGFAGLRNGHHERTRGQNRVTVTEFVREFDFHGDTHPVFDGVLGYLAGVAGGAAGHDDDFVDGLEVVFVDTHFIKGDAAIRIEAAKQGALHCGRVFVDLLVHKGIPAALFGGRSIPIHGVGLRVFDHVAVEIGDDDLVGGHAYGLILVDFHGTLGVGHECGDVGTEEVLPLAKAHDQRRIMAGSDHDVRLAAVGGQNGERAFKHAGHAAHSLEQVWLAFVRDNLVHDLAEQLSGHLSVGGRGESVAFGLQVETQLRGVFDDAVMDDGHLAVHAGVRVGVHVARLAIGGPARVADAHRGKRHRLTLDVFDQVLQTAGLLAHDHLIHAGRGQRHTGRVIASVFQTFQALQADLQRLAACRFNISRVSNDSTHGSPA